MGAGNCYLPILNWATAACRGYLAKNWPVLSRYQFSDGCSCNAAKGIVTLSATQPFLVSSRNAGGALRDDTKNGCVAD